MLNRIQVIIPALDEAATIGAVVTQLRSIGLSRIRVVDNGSRDGTAEIARAAGAEVLFEPVAGYGRACWLGYQNLDADVAWILFADADGSDDLGDVERLIREAEVGADFVLGDRRAWPEARAVMTPVQNFGNGLATTLIRFGWGQRYHDLGPLRLIRRRVLERIDMQDRGFGWTIEMQVRAVEVGARIVELPVGYRRRQGGRSKISGTIKGSVQAGTIILSTIAQLGWRRLSSRWCAGGQWLAAALVLLGAGAMVPFGDFGVAGTVPAFWAAAAVIALGWGLAQAVGCPARIFWGVAVGARLILLPMAPGDDVWRYLWEGLIQQNGFSPYQLAPAADGLAALRPAWWGLVNHPQATAIYGPAAELLWRGLAALGSGVLGLKVLFVAADLALSGLLVRRFDTRAAVLYAWNPLVLHSVAGAAHFESVLMLPVVAAWLGREKSGKTGNWPALGLGLSIALKWMTAPLAAWVLWRERRDGRRTLALALVMTLPTALGLAWYAGGYGGLGALLPGDFVNKARTLDVVPWLGQLLYPPSYLGNSWVALAFAPVAAWVFFRARSLAGFAVGFYSALFFFAPSNHPWYALWLLPFAVATGGWAPRVLSVTFFVYYAAWIRFSITGYWGHSTLERALVWLPFGLALVWDLRGSKR